MRLLCVGLLALGGCAELGGYLEARGLDLADTFKVSVGVGLGAALDLRATDWLAMGLGYYSYARCFGWDGREVHGTWEEVVVITTPRAVIESAVGTQAAREAPDYDPRASLLRLLLSSVFLANERWIRDADGRVWVEFHSLLDAAPVSRASRLADPSNLLLREGEKARVRDRTIFDRTWFEAGATAGVVAARIGVNPLEALDFAVGWLGLDLAGDDR